MKFFLGCLVLAGLAVAGLLVYVGSWANVPFVISAEHRVELARGQSFSSFAAALAEEDLITRPRLWSWQARWQGNARRVQAGEYWIQPGDTPASLLDKLLTGDVISYEIQLIEGWTLREVLASVAGEEVLEHELGAVDANTLLGVLGLPSGNAEGLFFPDTYQFTRGASDVEILQRAYDQMQQKLAEAWQNRDVGLPYENAYQALIAASLVEKETGRDADRPHIAQVFVSRLHARMRLQTDPAVIYGLGKSFNGNLTRKHLRTDTPYNTYTRKGLPPTPIAIAGARSIEAALHPAGGDYLYFVSGGDGSSHFSVSLEEHEAAVRKYQLR